MLLLTGSVIYNDQWNNALNHEDKGVAINFVDNRNGAVNMVKMEYLKMVLVKVYVLCRF